MRSFIPTIGWLSLCILTGCSESNPRLEVVGAITLQGTPLDEGIIEFQPIEATPGVPTTAAGAVISEGQYKIPAEHGLAPGHYRVLITAGDGRTPDTPDGLPGPSGNFVSKDRIPTDFNRNSKLRVEVKPKSLNEFSFAIP